MTSPKFVGVLGVLFKTNDIKVTTEHFIFFVDIMFSSQGAVEDD